MCTDMVGYTALGQRNESLSLALVEEQRKLLRPIFNKHSGREVKTMGDAFLVEFPSALDAVRCAYDIQRATREFNISLAEEHRIHLRVGVHLGDVVESEGDISGDAVNVGSRIEGLAEDGGVCLTRQVYDQVQNKFELPMRSLGLRTLKNVASPLEVYKMVMPWGEEKVPPSTKLDKRRIAILPFASMSPDPNDEYFADGMTEELITAMSGLQGLQVIARTSVMNYKKKEKNVSEIGKELGVGTVLEGSVRKAGNKVRVTAQLIDVHTESHLWAEKYDRELDDIFKIQDDISGKIAEALKVKLASVQGSGRKHPVKIELYTLYLKGRSLWNKRDKEGVSESLKLFQGAIRIDPDYPSAYSGLADAYHIAATYGFMDRAVGLAKSKDAATKALELDDTLSEAHASLGLNLFYELRYEEAQREFRRAIELNPSYASAHHWLGILLQDVGRFDEGMEEVAKATELDPLSPVIMSAYANALHLAERDDDWMTTLNRLVQTQPDFQFAYLARSWLYAFRGQKDEALSDLETYRKLSKDECGYEGEMAISEVLWGNTQKGTEHMEKALSLMDKSPPEYAFTPYWFYALIGDKQQFFVWVERAFEKQLVSGAALRYDPCLRKMKDDPRYKGLYKRLNLSE
jgi:adenylate cyclase